MLKFGSARIDENGHITGGERGDSTGHEVEMQNFYVHKKGWLVFRARDPIHAERLAERMKRACKNNNIGYNQSRRYEIIQRGIDAKSPTDCDCSSLVRQCIYEATGKDVGNFTTQTEPYVLERSGLFKEAMIYTSNMILWDGDILVTRSSGHTGIVCEGNPRTINTKKKSVDEVARDVIKGLYGIGATRRQMLTDAGYNYSEVQLRVNEILRGNK